MLVRHSSSLYFITGITLSGVNQALTVGQSATITCSTNIEVSSIEWRDQSTAVLSSATDQTVVEYSIPLVRDDLHGLQYTCKAVAGTTIYTETVQIQVVGKCMLKIYKALSQCCFVWNDEFRCTCICIKLMSFIYMYMFINNIQAWQTNYMLWSCILNIILITSNLHLYIPVYLSGSSPWLY